MSRYNDDYDSDSDNEPIVSSDHFKERHDSCTDWPCCCLWMVCLVAFMGVIGYGYTNGNTRRLHHGIDVAGRVCGVDVGVEAYPYTYFCPPGGAAGLAGGLTQSFTLSNPVCVAACPVGPNASDVVVPSIIPQCAVNFSTTAYKTKVMMNYCMPDKGIHSSAAHEVGTAISGYIPTMMKAADSIALGWPIYVLIFFLSILLGYAYICCLKVFARAMVWLAIIVAFLTFLVVGAYLVYQAPTIGTNEVMTANFGKFATNMSYAVGFLCLGGAAGICCLACCCAGQITHAVIAIQMTTDVMACIPSLLFAPVVKAIVKMFVGGILLAGFVNLLSCAKPTSIAGSAMARQFAYKDDEWYFIWFYIFMFYWVMAFLTGLYQFAIAYATADYFYANAVDYDGERDVGCCGMVEGLCVGLMWHQGSFAFGGAIIAFFSTLQRAIEYIEKSNRDPTGTTKNPCVTIITCACMCCVTMCKSCAEFINKNAYIGIAVKGVWFCTACKNAFKIMIENAGAMAILNGATYVFQIAGILLITATCAFISDAICNLSTFTDPSSKWFLPHPPVVVIISAVVGFAMAKIFMDVFDMVSDTLLYCFGLEGWSKMSSKVPEPMRRAVSETEQLSRGGGAGYAQSPY